MDIREVIGRMASGEKGLHTKTVGNYKLVRRTGLPVLLEELVASDLKKKKYVLAKRVKQNNIEILILKRPEL